MTDHLRRPAARPNQDFGTRKFQDESQNESGLTSKLAPIDFLLSMRHLQTLYKHKMSWSHGQNGVNRIKLYVLSSKVKNILLKAVAFESSWPVDVFNGAQFFLTPSELEDILNQKCCQPKKNLSPECVFSRRSSFKYSKIKRVRLDWLCL